MEEGENVNEYKIKQLTEMLKFEEQQPTGEKYGAHLTHWSGHGNPINLDEGALKVLINYYREKVTV